METKEIQKLLDFIAGSGLDEVIIETSELKVKVRRNSTVQTVVAAPSSQVAVSPAVQAVSAAPAVKKEAVAPNTAEGGQSDSKLVTIKSPMIGTFYRASSPESPSFVNVGDEIKPGKVVCVIEAMKLFNEIESELSGKIVKILVENATPVEFDQPLFQVELD